MKIPPEITSLSFSLKLTPRRSLIAVAIASVLTFMTVRCGISQEDLLKFYNEIRKVIKFDLPDEKNILNEIDSQLNQKIIKDPKLLDYKVRRDVDDAIWSYQQLTGDTGVARITPPRYSERPVDASVCYTPECQALGGEMRICAPWVDTCKTE